MSLQVEIHEQLNASLFSQWQELWQQSLGGHFFNAPQWFLACVEARPSESYRVVTVREHGELLAVLPLHESRRFGIKTQTCPGGRYLSKLPLLMKRRDFAVLAELLDFLAGRGNYYLPELDEALLDFWDSRDGSVAVREASVSPYVPLGGDPFFYVSKKLKSRIRNLVKKHEKHLVYRCLKGSGEGLELAFGLDWRSGRRKRGKAVFPDSRDREFFWELLRNFGERVVVDCLYYDNVPIVFGLGFAYKRTYHNCNTAYDRDYRRLSPRKLLLYYTLRRLKEEGFEIFDFSRGDTDLKREFTPLSQKQYDVYRARNVLARKWWQAANGIYQMLLANRIFYPSYLAFKGLFINLKDRLQKNGPGPDYFPPAGAGARRTAQQK